MRTSHCVAVAFLLVTGCAGGTDNSGSPLDPAISMKKNPSIRKDAVPVTEFPSGVKVFRMEDMEPGVAARLLEQADSPEFHAMVKASVERAPHQYAIADAKLPEDAMAMIVRDPNAAFELVIVFQRDRLTDNAMAVARLALFEDELAEPNIASRRSILVWENQSVRVGNVVKRMHYNLGTDQPGEAALLRSSETEILLPELGAVRFVK